MAGVAEYHRDANVLKQVALQEAEERRLRDEELERMKLEWLDQMRVSAFWALLVSCTF